MDDLFDILDNTEPPKPEVNVEKPEEPKPQKSNKVNLWEDEIDPLEIDKENLLRFNRMFTVASFGEVPGEAIVLAEQLAKYLHSKGFTYRFDGGNQDKLASTAYGATSDRAEIYLPWKGFNKELTGKLSRPSETAYGYAAAIHKQFNTKAYEDSNSRQKKFNDLPPTVRAIISKNVHMLLGDLCNTPVNLCMIYTADGAESRQDIKYETTGHVAFYIQACELLDIPVFNLKNATAKERIGEFLNTMLKDK